MNAVSLRCLDEMIDGLCEWFVCRQNTRQGAPKGWFGEYGEDTRARGVLMDVLVPMRQLYAVTAVLKTGIRKARHDWLRAGNEALEASLAHYGDINILDYHAAYMLLRLKELGVIEWNKGKEDFVLRIVDFLIRNVSDEYTFPHHVGTDPAQVHGNGSSNHPVGTPIGVARFFFEWSKHHFPSESERSSRIIGIARRCLKKALSAQSPSGGIPYNFSSESVPSLHYHIGNTRGVLDIYYQAEADVRKDIHDALVNALDYILSPGLKSDGTLDIEKHDSSLAAYFTTTYTGGIATMALAEKVFPDRDYGRCLDRLVEKLHSCYDPVRKSLREQVELVETHYYKEFLKLTDFSQPRWDSYPMNAQGVYELCLARDA